MPVAIPTTAKRTGFGYVGLICHQCGTVITRKIYDTELNRRDNVFCGRACKRAWDDEHGMGKIKSNIYASMDAPKSCQKKLRIIRCDECPLPDCEWKV